MLERMAKVEVRVEYLEEKTDKLEKTLETVGDIAKTTKTQILLGVGLIVTLINVAAKFL